jgi:hypothetical protein
VRPIPWTIRPGGAFEPCGLPDPPGQTVPSPGPSENGPTQGGDLDLHPGTLRKAVRPADSGLTNASVQRKVLDMRKPASCVCIIPG